VRILCSYGPRRGLNRTSSLGGVVVLALLALALALPAVSRRRQRSRSGSVALTPFAANTVAKLGVTPVAIGETLGGSERFSPKLKGVPALGSHGSRPRPDGNPDPAPPLAGLADGDVATLTENLRVAFSVTVAGLMIGAFAPSASP
jgi:hypothetical protein